MANRKNGIFEKMRPAGYFLLAVIATQVWTLLDYLGIIGMARLGMGARARWQYLTEKERSHHA